MSQANPAGRAPGRSQAGPALLAAALRDATPLRAVHARAGGHGAAAPSPLGGPADVLVGRGAPSVSLLGTSALLFEAPGETTLPTQQRIWALAHEAETWPEVREAIPGMNNLMLRFARPPSALDALEARLHAAWTTIEPLTLRGRVVELPVVYGGDGGPHMADVVAHTGLHIDEIVERHSAPLYPVYALGSHPGYCYLGGMDPRIATPRREVPVLRIPGGAVSIGGMQTGVSASDGPSGWNTIGCTTMAFFDPTRNPPALLQPGDSIRFRVEKVIR